MTSRSIPIEDDLDVLLAPHFRPIETGGDLARRALDRLRDERDLERLADGVRVEVSARGVVSIDTSRSPGYGRPVASAATRTAKRIADRTREELREYLQGRRSFFSVPVDLSRIPAFQRQVLDLTSRIPFGETRSYGWIAREIGHPGAMRAVGTALGRNPVPIVVPCHRVLRSDGSLGGYGLGLPIKTRLLELEGTTPVLEGCATTGILCRVGCSAGHRMREDSRVIFASIEDARSVGYRPCKVCRPAAA